MDENTLNIVASNLTIAYFSIKPTVNVNSILAERNKQKSGFIENPEDKVIKIFTLFYNHLAKSE